MTKTKKTSPKERAKASSRLVRLKAFLARFKKWHLLVALVLLIFSGAAFASIYSQKQPDDSFKVERGDLATYLEVSGTVQAPQRAELSFEQTAKIDSIQVAVNARVQSGKLLASQTHKELEARRDEAAASLNQERASYGEIQASVLREEARLTQYQAAVDRSLAELDDLKNAPSTEELNLANTKVENAQSSLEEAKADLEQTLEANTVALNNEYSEVKLVLSSAYDAASDTLQRLLDEIFVNDQSFSVDWSFQTSNSGLATIGKSQRRQAESKLDSIRDDKNTVQSLTINSETYAELDEILKDSEDSLVFIQGLLSTVSQVLADSFVLSETTLASYQANVNTARGQINDALSDINSLEQSIRSQVTSNESSRQSAQIKVTNAENTLKQTERELEVTQAGPTDERIRQQEAAVEQARADLRGQEANVQEAKSRLWSQSAQIDRAKANLASAEAELEKRFLYAPFDGVVIRSEREVGEVANANEMIFTLISYDEFEIETDIPEIDISKIELGDEADVTLDAYGTDRLYTAVLSEIESGERIVEGLTRYRTRFAFVEADESIRSGMTANLRILTEEKLDVLRIPLRYLGEDDSGSWVITLDEVGNEKRIEVETGLKSTDGWVEVINGLSEEDVLMPLP